jgi:hypothetical protein
MIAAGGRADPPDSRHLEADGSMPPSRSRTDSTFSAATSLAQHPVRSRLYQWRAPSWLTGPAAPIPTGSRRFLVLQPWVALPQIGVDAIHAASPDESRNSANGTLIGPFGRPLSGPFVLPLPPVTRGPAVGGRASYVSMSRRDAARRAERAGSRRKTSVLSSPSGSTALVKPTTLRSINRSIVSMSGWRRASSSACL